MQEVVNAIQNKEHLLLQAHTGYGKTDAVLSAALSAGIENNMKVVFLTPKKSQHALSIEILRQLNEQHSLGIKAVDLLGKREYCISRAREVSEFYEYCSMLKKKGLCPYYTSFKNDGVQLSGTCGKEEIIAACKTKKIPPCPYEVAMDAAKDAEVVVCDYNYLFSGIRKQFLSRTGLSLSDTIIVVDEAHNLPERIRENMSATLTSRMLKKAIKEHKALGEDRVELSRLERMIPSYSEGNETIMEKAEVPLPDLDSLLETGLEWLESHESSSTLQVHRFFRLWEQEGPEFFRILRKKDNGFSLSIRCLDPGNMAGPIVSKAGSMIFMSATLAPFDMYAHLMRLQNYKKKVMEPIFPAENRVCIVSSSATSRWKERDEKGYRIMAERIDAIASATPGNTAVFFPSFEFLEQISRRTSQEIVRQNRTPLPDLLTRMAQGDAVLYAVSGGSLAEGVNLPDIKTVVIAGLPLPSPSMEQLALQEYYERMFGKGFEYAFLYPAVKKALQAAGRCIRKPSQRGAVVFLDHRFSRYLNMIKRYYPDAELCDTPEKRVKEFWSR